MKKLLALVLLVSCAEKVELKGPALFTCKTAQGATVVSSEPCTASSAPQEPVTPGTPVTPGASEPVTPTTPTTPTEPVTPPPASRRTDLYSCSSITNDQFPSAEVSATVEVYENQSRLYSVAVKFQDGFTEEFKAGEAPSEAKKYPIKEEIGAVQSSNVLHGMSEQLRTKLDTVNGDFQINLKSSATQGNVEMFLSLYDSVGLRSLDLPYSVCFRVSN